MNLVIDSFLIVDAKNKESNKFIFGKKANIITSKDNGVGKSSVIKSIYYALGVDIKSKSEGWRFDEFIFQLVCSVGNDSIIIQRKNDLFIVKEKDNIFRFNDKKSFSEWLQNIMDIDLKLSIKKSGELITAYTNAMIDPYYVDQDKSWNRLYKDTFSNLQMYENIPHDIFNYYLGISENKIQELAKQKDNLKKDKHEVEKKKDYLWNLILSFKERNETYGIDYESYDELKFDMDSYIESTNRIENKVAGFIKKIVMSKKKNNDLLNNISEIDNLLHNIKDRFNKINVRCAYCNSYITREQSVSRLELRDNFFDLYQLKLDFEDKSKKEEEKIIKYKNEITLLKEEFEKRNKLISSFKKSKSIDDLVNKKMISELYKVFVKCDNKITLFNNDINKLTNQIKDLKKREKNRRDKVKKEYKKLIDEISEDMNIPIIQNKKFLSFADIKETGTELNKAILGMYLVYFNLLVEFNQNNFPMAIDSFVKNEISNKNEISMFNIVQNKFLSLDCQTFFSAIERNVGNLNVKECNVIHLENSVLKSSYYDELKNEIII